MAAGRSKVEHRAVALVEIRQALTSREVTTGKTAP